MDDLLCKVDEEMIIGLFWFGFAFNFVAEFLLACKL